MRGALSTISFCVGLAVVTGALASDHPVELDKIKLSASGAKQKLSLSFRNDTLPFPPNSGAMRPELVGLSLEIQTSENPSGSVFTAPANAAGPDPGWKYKGGAVDRNSFRHRFTLLRSRAGLVTGRGRRSTPPTRRVPLQLTCLPATGIRLRLRRQLLRRRGCPVLC